MHHYNGAVEVIILVSLLVARWPRWTPKDFMRLQTLILSQNLRLYASYCLDAAQSCLILVHSVLLPLRNGTDTRTLSLPLRNGSNITFSHWHQRSGYLTGFNLSHLRNYGLAYYQPPSERCTYFINNCLSSVRSYRPT